MNWKTKVLTGSAAAVVVALIALVIWWPSGDGGEETLPSMPSPSAPASLAPTTVAGPVYDVAEAATLIATLRADIPAFGGPNGEETGTIAATWHDRPKSLPVIDQQPGWFHVRLPERPNGSTAWIRSGDVDVSTTTYRIEVDVAAMRLRLFDAGEVVMDVPAGIGTDDAPTTVGNFFLAFLQEPPDTTSGWGPFVMVTSSHSETISDFEQSGDAIAAIHGPLGAAEEIGQTGAKVSHGCIRLHLEDLERLRDVPAGTPVDVIDSSEASA